MDAFSVVTTRFEATDNKIAALYVDNHHPCKSVWRNQRGERGSLPCMCVMAVLGSCSCLCASVCWRRWLRQATRTTGCKFRRRAQRHYWCTRLLLQTHNAGAQCPSDCLIWRRTRTHRRCRQCSHTMGQSASFRRRLLFASPGPDAALSQLLDTLLNQLCRRRTFVLQPALKLDEI